MSREETIDKIAQTLDRDDMVMTTMSTFVSSTVHCARCHNHKFDPMSQKEYYRLQAVSPGWIVPTGLTIAIQPHMCSGSLCCGKNALWMKDYKIEELAASLFQSGTATPRRPHPKASAGSRRSGEAGTSARQQEPRIPEPGLVSRRQSEMGSDRFRESRFPSIRSIWFPCSMPLCRASDSRRGFAWTFRTIPCS